MLQPSQKALVAQLGGLALVFTLTQNGILQATNLFHLAIAQGVFAAIISILLASARWWLPIHLCFMPAIILAARATIPAWYFGAGFICLALFYWSNFRTQVPLFLSNKTTVHRLAAWFPSASPLKVLDLGSGTGSFVLRLARLRPDWQITGIESAPAPCWISFWRACSRPNASFLRGDFWQMSFDSPDIVYAFLSPAPMPFLWKKAREEMRSGGWLICNSFPLPDRTPDHTLKVDDKRQTKLYCYRIP